MKKFICLFFLPLALSGCASILSSFSSRIADDLADAILNSNDIETVREAIPAYLLLMDGLLNSRPNNVELLFAAASLTVHTVSIPMLHGQRCSTKKDSI